MSYTRLMEYVVAAVSFPAQCGTNPAANTSLAPLPSTWLSLCAVVSTVGLMMVVITLVVQGNAVELKERIRCFVTRRGEPAIERYTRHIHLLGTANVYAFAFLDVPKVDSINTATGMGHDGWFHMSDQGPLCSSEECVNFNIGCASSGTESSVLIFNQ